MRLATTLQPLKSTSDKRHRVSSYGAEPFRFCENLRRCGTYLRFRGYCRDRYGLPEDHIVLPDTYRVAKRFRTNLPPSFRRRFLPYCSVAGAGVQFPKVREDRRRVRSDISEIRERQTSRQNFISPCAREGGLSKGLPSCHVGIQKAVDWVLLVNNPSKHLNSDGYRWCDQIRVRPSTGRAGQAVAGKLVSGDVHVSDQTPNFARASVNSAALNGLFRRGRSAATPSTSA